MSITPLEFEPYQGLIIDILSVPLAVRTDSQMCLLHLNVQLFALQDVKVRSVRS
jgi:hypothetical protein